MTFRPFDETAFDPATALSAEHGRRIVQDGVEVVNERCVQSGGAFRRYNGGGGELRTLWRWSANWGYIGPFEVFVPPQNGGGFVRMLIGARTNGGNGNVRVYTINEAGRSLESSMDAATSGGAPGVESVWFVCESDSGTTDFDFVVLVRVFPGWNRLWLAIKCDEDADRTPEVFTSATYSLVGLGASFGMPAIESLTIVDNDPVGMVADVSPSASLYSDGTFSRFTVGALNSGEDPLLFEMAPSLVQSFYEGVYPYCRISWVVPIYIDSISFDGSAATALSGDAFRYRQPVSAGFTRVATDAAQNAHLARLPLSAVVPQLGAEVLLAVDSAGTLRRHTLITETATDIPIALLGIAKATPDVDLQATFSGSWTYEARLSADLFLVASPFESPVDVEFSLAVVDAAGADIVAAGVVVVSLDVSSFGPDRTVDDNAALASVGTTLGLSDWLLEGMSTRAGLSSQEFTFRITVTDDLDAEPVQRLVLRVRTPVFRGTTLLYTSPISVRLTDGN